MKLILLNPIDQARPHPVKPIVPTLSLLEPINLQVQVGEDELDLVGTNVKVQLIGSIELLRYDTYADAGSLVSFKARPVRTEDVLDIHQTAHLRGPRGSITIDLISSGIDVSQLPSSIEVMGGDASDTSPLMQLVVRYVLSVSDCKGRTVHQGIHMLGHSLSETEGRAEAKLLRPQGGYKRHVSQGSSMWNWARLGPLRHFRPTSRPCQQLTVEVMGYDPIVLRHEENAASTKIRWRLRLADGQQDSTSSIPKVTMSARWRLRSSTEWPISASEESPIRINHSGNLDGWTSMSGKPETVSVWLQGVEGSLEAEHSTSLSLPVQQFLAPTFFLGSMAHTYTLHLAVCCRAKGHALNIRGNLEFELPIALIYVAPGYDSDDVPPVYSEV
ncbi:hypothetical protein PV08_08730 [Exophiala spinifera]|uniref:Uncharacterized protein n=1 Tax=Exophiala spinifera TaxID=91928 RepID=A0A0D1ZL68_9EURO|nr:uncharacterized protein PV08_08730 [Exophiala spinifera]KIW13542.1 hypothetical protein PV08_08730 [Exophiala spinifera]